MQAAKKEYPFDSIPRELWLLLACAERNTAKVQALAVQPIDWNVFLEMAVHHRVYPLVYRTLSGLDEPLVPAQVLDCLREKYRKNAWQAMQMAGETVQLVKLLTNNGIQTTVLKGVVLALRLYGDPAARTSRDIDLLVRPEDMARADALLLEHGYRRDHPAYEMTPRRWLYLQNNRHFCYIHQETGLYIELHWQLGYVGMQLPHAAGSSAATVEVAGCMLPVFADEEWFLFLVQHGAYHAWFRLRWLCDIAVFMQGGQLDWVKVMALADVYGMRHVLQQAVFLAHRLLGAPISPLVLPVYPGASKPLRLVELAVPFFCDIKYNPSTVTLGQELYHRDKEYQVALRNGWQNKLEFVLEFVLSYFGPTESDILRFPLPDGLYWLYYLIRPFTGLERRYRRWYSEICRIC